MAAASARRRAIGALTLVGACGFGAATPVAAADGDEPIVLSQHAFSGVTADLDGDGTREIVILSGGDGGNPLMVELWAFAGDRWSLVGREDVRYRGEDGRMAELVDGEAGVGLLVFQDGPIERPLVLTAAGAIDGEGCCLTISEVVIESGRMVLRTVPGSLGDASYVLTLDADGDRTDELLVVAGELFAEPAVRADVTTRLLRRSDGGTWSNVPVDLPEDAAVYAGFVVLDSDGVPGEELLFQNEDNRLFRFYGSGTGLAVEAVDIPARPSRDGPYVVGAVGGDVGFVEANRVALARWPRGGDLRTRAEVELDPTTFPYVIGSGPNARLGTVQYHDTSIGQPTELDILGHDLELEMTVTATPTRLRLDRLYSRGMLLTDPAAFPFEGPILGGTTSGEDLFVTGGWLITLSPDGSHVEPVGMMFGTTPLGLAGPDDAWVLTSTGYAWSTRDQVGLAGGVGPAGPLSVMSRAALFAPDPTAGVDMSLEDAVDLGWSEDGARQIATAGSFVAELFAPPGTSAWVLRNGGQLFDGIVTEDSVRVDLEDPGIGRSDRNGSMTVEVLLASPTGQVVIEEWQVDILRVPPEVSAEAEVEAFALEASVSGTASPGTTLTVDGAPVEVDADGRFTATVDAPIWPREVVVTATDPVGNASTTRLEIVGFVDYRGWPWPVLIGLVTVAGGVLMYLRAPRWVAERARQAPAPAFDDDARLEELDPDRA